MTQSLPLTFADALCVEDLDAFGGETTSDLQTLEQDVLHILIEAPGSNLDDPDRGIGVDLFLSGDVASVLRLPAIIEAELLKDDRITAVTASVTRENDGSYTLAITIGVSGEVLGLTYSYTDSGGLQSA